MKRQTDKSILNENRITVNAIFAVGKNGEMGNADGSLPWCTITHGGRQVIKKDLPQEVIEQAKADMENFKRLTTNNIVVMGYNTYKTFSAPLPNRVNIVVDGNFGNHDTSLRPADNTFSQSDAKDATGNTSFTQNRASVENDSVSFSNRWIFSRTLEDAIQLAKKIALESQSQNGEDAKTKEIFIIGGARTLQEAFQKKLITGEVYKTVINADFHEATVRFP